MPYIDWKERIIRRCPQHDPITLSITTTTSRVIGTLCHLPHVCLIAHSRKDDRGREIHSSTRTAVSRYDDAITPYSSAIFNKAQMYRERGRAFLSARNYSAPTRPSNSVCRRNEVIEGLRIFSGSTSSSLSWIDVTRPDRYREYLMYEILSDLDFSRTRGACVLLKKIRADE